ncbi:MAG: hypothetical protein M1835_006769 [Candelina submexicana]|nr:MAG: hypothetical protein M1835_006769 [Candelina submexicana]
MSGALQTANMQKALADAFAQVHRHTKRAIPSSRVNIVSPKLCDDVLTKLAPSLKGHKNCDLVELNPGPGLWSSKIHEVLQPRAHILVERDLDVYLPFLSPLLNKSDSRYRMAPPSDLGNGDFWHKERANFDINLLPLQRFLKPDEPESNDVNRSLLLIANLAQYPVKRFGSLTSLPHLIMHQLISAIRHHSGFQAYGLVRMLVWVVDSEKKTLLPRTIAERKKFTVQTEISTDIEEIAGAQELAGFQRREDEIDVASAARVARNIRELGLRTPGGSSQSREAPMVAQSHVEGVSSDASKARFSRLWYEELAGLEQRYEQGLIKEYVEDLPPHASKEAQSPGPPKMERKGRKARGELTPEFQRIRELRKQVKVAAKNKGRVGRLLDEQAALEDLELLIASGTLTQEEKEGKEKLLKESTDRFRCNLEKVRTPVQERLAYASDDWNAFRRKDPLLMWDRRISEPIEVQADDFFPNQKLALLDLQPKPLPLSLRSSPKLYALFEYILGNLFVQPKQSIAQGLNQLAPGAAEALIPEVPALTDPQRGGRTDVEQLRVRMLTFEMLEGLTLAWDKWVFKPEMGDLMMRVGNAPPELVRPKRRTAIV